MAKRSLTCRSSAASLEALARRHDELSRELVEVAFEIQ